MRRKILVDQSVVSNALRELLQLEGYEVEEVADHQKALSIVRCEECDAVISDILNDGLRILQDLKAISSSVPVILISNEHILTRSEAIELGAYALIEQSEVASEQLNNIKKVLARPNRLESALAV
jgi:two-component system C4-dicarboxylate transport response regulator DctD